MWFDELTGFSEAFPQQVRKNISVDAGEMTSLVNGAVFTCGVLETPSLAEMRRRIQAEGRPAGRIAVREVVANVQHLHTDKANAGALFQVASQFNLLEMASPNNTPEQGVAIYELDRTQGPACAIAAGAGTIYRNYFARVNGEIGQTATNQLDCLADVGKALGNIDGQLWQMRNGYALASEEGLVKITHRLQSSSDIDRDRLRDLLRIGIHWNTQVTLNESRHLVSQAYCSALPVAYSPHSETLWAEFAVLVLEASYEATFCAAIVNAKASGNNTLFLTLLGGGAFGNQTDWIIHAIERTVDRYQDYPLDVAIVSYGGSHSRVRELVRRYTR
ncbi:MAG: hypothetical protein AAFN77_24345 [Planctomycetota bacterium]